MDEGQVELLKFKLRQFFQDAKREATGRTAKLSNRHDKPEYWRAMAESCIELKADPYMFIKAAFTYCPLARGPFVVQLIGGAAKAWYRQYEKNFISQQMESEETPVELNKETDVLSLVQSEFKLAKSKFYHMTGSTSPQDNYEYLASFLATLPAYVRVCLGKDSARVVTTWGDEAMKEILTNPQLNEILKKMGYDVESIINGHK